MITILEASIACIGCFGVGCVIGYNVARLVGKRGPG